MRVGGLNPLVCLNWLLRNKGVITIMTDIKSCLDKLFSGKQGTLREAIELLKIAAEQSKQTSDCKNAADNSDSK